MKTMEDWQKSDALYFDEFVNVGDIVGEDVIDYFRNSVPPIIDKKYILQAGDPYSTVNGKSTYTTFTKEDEGWVYRGNCFKGETKEPKDPKIYGTSKFYTWLDNFVKEKGIDISKEFKTSKLGISQTFSYEDIINNIKAAPENEQSIIKDTLVKLDFANKDILDYLRFLSKALLPSIKEVKEMEDVFGESINLEIDRDTFNTCLKAEELVDRIHESYSKGNLEEAYKSYCNLYDLFNSENKSEEDKIKNSDNLNEILSEISDKELYDITDYGKEKSYREMGFYDSLESESDNEEEENL